MADNPFSKYADNPFSKYAESATPEQTTQAALTALKNNGWGTGFAPMAHKAGEIVNDAAVKYFPPWASAALGSATNTAINAVPILASGNLTGTAAEKAATPALEETGKWLMKSAIKPMAQDLEKGRVPAAVQTMLEGGYNPTEAGMAAMRAKVSEYMDQVKNIIAPSNKMVSLGPAADNLVQQMSRAGAGTMGQGNIAQIQSVAKNLYEHPSVVGDYIPVQAAQAMKQANTAELGSNAYGLGLKPAAERDALKAVNAALREGIEKAEPAVAPLNAKASELLNAMKVAQRRALIESNKNPLPLGASLGALAHDPLATLGLWANSSALAKAMAARGLYNGAQAIPQVGGFAAGAGVGAYPALYPQGALYQ